MAVPSNPAETVEALLRRRAMQGAFRSFAAQRARGRLDCSFVWLKERPTRLVFDPTHTVLEFRDLLPNVAADSALYADLQKFLKQRTRRGLPAHRSIDPERIRARRRNSTGSNSIILESLDGDLEYAVSQGLKLVNEIFLGFLKGPYSDYMVEHCQDPEG